MFVDCVSIIALTLKPPTYRSAVGVDHVTVKEDSHGNCCEILVVEHFSHFPVAYPAKDYSARSTAIALFKHFCTHGKFEKLCSDPGSAFMSEVIQHLNGWLSMEHKVSLVERHESNGCEASGKQFLRHLKTLLMDERTYDRWSDDTVLPLINLHLQSYPTLETGGYTPQLKYGTEDARQFILLETLRLPNGEIATQLIQELDGNLKHIRSISKRLQAKLAEERCGMEAPQYQQGDLLLYNPREKPTDFLASKLHPTWLGPYEVLEQR